MSNLLLNQANWTDGSNSPPACWAAGTYVALNNTQNILYTGPAPVAGDVVAFSTHDVSPLFGNYSTVSANGAQIGANIVPTATPTTYSTAIPAGASNVRVAIYAGNGCGSDTIYVTPTPPVFTCEGPILEVWPPPNDTYTLRLRGFPVVKDFGVPDPITGLYNDAGVTACDSRLVFLMALATAKAHYGRQDASVSANELTSLLGTLRAGEHGNKRYVPGADDLDPRKMYVEPHWIR